MLRFTASLLNSFRQIIYVAPFTWFPSKWKDVEALLTLCDAIDPFLKVAPTQEVRRRESDDEDDEDSEAEGRKGISQGIRRTMVHDDGDSDDDDLDM